MLRTFLSIIALGGLIAASETPSAACDTIFVNGEKKVICSPPPTPPPGSDCRGPACRPKPTK